MSYKISNYPADFVYLRPAKVKSTMGRMSADVQRINEILTHTAAPSGSAHEQIVGALENIEAEVYKLGAGTATTNHILIDKHIDRFKEDVQAALKAAKGSPANYYLAGKLSGSCLACHIYR